MTVTAYGIEDRVFSGRFQRQRYRPEGMPLDEQKAIVDRLLDWALDGEFRGMVGPAHWWMMSEQFDTLGRIREAGGINVVRTKGRPCIKSWAYPARGRISMGALAGPALVCHEFAHIITPNGPGHGSDWRIAYVECVRVEIGDFHAERLRLALATAYDPDRDRAIARRRR